MEPRFELSAAIALWDGPRLLFMKRSSGSFGGGGWFLPGGHLEPDERPAEAAVRELREETGIIIPVEALAAATVMSYERAGATAHSIVYNAQRPAGQEVAINDEHVVAKWYEPEAAIARFFDPTRLRGLGVAEPDIALAAEVGRVVREASRARGMRGLAESRPEEARVTGW